MKDVVLFGAGKIGRKAATNYKAEGRNIKCFIDNGAGKNGTRVDGVEVVSWDKFISETDCSNIELVLTCNIENQYEIEKQLLESGISKYTIYQDEQRKKPGGRLILYSDKRAMEDLILYHVLKDEKEIFYIDVGSNDPFGASVTKLFYDVKQAHGINIEPQSTLIEITERERPRDINLCAGAGDTPCEMTLYLQGGASTLVDKNQLFENCKKETIKVVTLKDVCEEYLEENQEISFLKIDVEGFEKQVLLGADFKKYRPKVLCMESTLPKTEIPSYEEWEPILLENGYHFVYSYWINRYYVADEEAQLDQNFWTMDQMIKYYDVCYAEGLK